MSQVRKGNRIITIEPHRVDDYVARGYDNIDEESGEVIKKGDPVSLADFKREYSSLKAQIKEKDAQAFTHSGKFHADDVFSSALLLSVNPEITIHRGSQVPEDFKGIVFDIGRGKYDHHQRDSRIRENGVPYAAFGLLWEELGAEILGEELAEKLSVSRQAVAKWKSGQVYPEITNLIQISNLLDAGSAEVFCTILHWCFPGLFPKYRGEITLTGKRQGGRNYRDRIIGMAKHILSGLYFFALYIGTDRNSHLFCEQVT